jgi:hypothetical protein
MSFALVSAGAGYLLHARIANGSLVLSTKDLLQGEYLVPPDSFSRAENTKNALEALGTRVRLGLEQAAITYGRLVGNGETSNRQAAAVLEGAIRDAETGVREFEGTEQELYIVRVLFRLLERAGRFDRWTELYLKALYEHPTHCIVSSFAGHAIRISRLAGQQEQVVDALRHLAALPAEFANRGAIEAALDSVRPSLAQGEVYSETGGERRSGKSHPDEADAEPVPQPLSFETAGNSRIRP